MMERDENKSEQKRLVKYKSHTISQVDPSNAAYDSSAPYFFPDIPVKQFKGYLQSQVVRLGGDMFDHLDVEMEVLQQLTQVSVSSSRIHRLKHSRAASKNRYNTVLPFTHCRVKLSNNGNQPSSSHENHNKAELSNTGPGGFFSMIQTPNMNQTPLNNIMAVSVTAEADFDENGDNDYINASHVNLASDQDRLHSRDYIAASAPLPSTMQDYWQMIYEQEIELVVMITKLVELGRVKAHEYWPKAYGKPECYDNGIEVTQCEIQHHEEDGKGKKQPSSFCPLELGFEVDPSRVVLRKFKVVNTRQQDAEPQIVVQIQYMAWPDHGVPSLDCFLDLFKVYRCVRQRLPSDLRLAPLRAACTRNNDDDENDDEGNEQEQNVQKLLDLRAPPILVHCSAGIGRTGTFLAIDVILDLLSIGRKETINVFDIVKQLRQCRPGMVQTKSQYAFIYDVINRCLHDPECPVYVDVTS